MPAARNFFDPLSIVFALFAFGNMRAIDPYLVPEWEAQHATIIAWPHENTDWHGMLHDIEYTYHELVRAIAPRQPLIILCSDREALAPRFSGYAPEQIRLIQVKTNDTWVRDYMPLWIRTEKGFELLDFGFNAWGGKHPFRCDNTATNTLYSEHLLFNRRALYRNLNHFILEGGSVETDGMGTVITTEECLCSGTRNPSYSVDEIGRFLCHNLRAKEIVWLRDCALDGDDTDGHVDMLVRFCAPDTIAYVVCEDSGDPQYSRLKAMEHTLLEWVGKTGRQYRLVGVPLPSPMYDASGRRLPATYLNFTIISGAVLVPIYGCSRDRDGLAVLESCFPDREVIGIYSGHLIRQGGAVHCATAQIPQACLKRI